MALVYIGIPIIILTFQDKDPNFKHCELLWYGLFNVNRYIIIANFKNLLIMWFICFLGLKFLVRLCTDLGLKDAQDYATKLKKAEKAKELREQVGLLLIAIWKNWQIVIEWYLKAVNPSDT